MALKRNYHQQRAERDRQARAKQAEKLKKLHEKSQQRKKVSLDKAASSDTEQVESAEQHVDYAAPAELFLAKRSGSPRARLGYRRFAAAAEAIRFAIEELPLSRLAGVYMQVGDLRYDANSIRLLYQRDDYPLKRSKFSACLLRSSF